MVFDRPLSQSIPTIDRKPSALTWELAVFLVILLIHGVYAGIYIYQGSFVFEGERYFVLFDDSMISMRYAKNLASGYGLVWNPGGERVEGYSNFLWVLLMAIFHLLPIPAPKTSLCLQILGGILLMLNLVWVRKIAIRISTQPGGSQRQRSRLVCIIAVLLTAFYFPLNYWGFMGCEVSLLALVVSMSVWEAMNNLGSERMPRFLYLLFVVGMLTRDDMLPIFIGILMFLFIADRPKRYRHILIGGMVLGSVIAVHTIFRWFYYGDILPNTYYLKLMGYPLLLRLSRGFIVFLNFLLRMNLSLVLLLYAATLIKRNRELALLGWICLIQSIYSVYVGGDAWEGYGWSNRFLSIVMPLLFLLLAVSLETLIEKRHNSSLFGIERADSTGWRMNLVRAGLVLVILVSLNAYEGLSSLRQWALTIRGPDVVALQILTKMGLTVRAFTKPEAKVALTWAGAAPYFMDRYAIDLLGKNDPWIAHQPMFVLDKHIALLNQLRFFWPGHLKFNYDYVLRDLQPDVVMQIWMDRKKALKMLAASYDQVKLCDLDVYVFLKPESPNIRWEVLVFR